MSDLKRTPEIDTVSHIYPYATIEILIHTEGEQSVNSKIDIEYRWNEDESEVEIISDRLYSFTDENGSDIDGHKRLELIMYLGGEFANCDLERLILNDIN